MRKYWEETLDRIAHWLPFRALLSLIARFIIKIGGNLQ